MREGKCVILVGEDRSCGAHRNAAKYDVWLLLDSDGCVGRKDCGTDRSGGTLRAEPADIYTGVRFLIFGKNCPLQTEQNDFDYNWEKNPVYFVIFNGSEASTIWVARGSHKYIFRSDDENAKLFYVNKTEEVRLPTECVFFELGNERCVGVG